MFNNTATNFIKVKSYTKYHFDFSDNFPLTDKDIQEVIEISKEEIKHILLIQTLVTRDIHQYNYHNYFHKMITLLDNLSTKILISDKTPIRKYGQYTCEEILSDIDDFQKAYPFSPFTENLLEIEPIIKNRSEHYERNLCDLIDHLNQMAEEISEDFKCPDHPQIPEEITTTKQILTKLKNIETTTKTLGSYNYKYDRITLYINNIIESFEDAPEDDFSLKIKTGLQIVLTHEYYHCLHFHMMGNNKLEKTQFWNCLEDEIAHRKCVVEGLATWFESLLCYKNKSVNFIFQWHRDKIIRTSNNNYYPNYPYAAVKPFLKDFVNSCINASEVFAISLLPDSTHWAFAYQKLVKLDKA